mgnify:CR=1 FL=1
MKQELILIKVGEIALKGLNRRTFEDVLMKNIKRHLAPLGKFEVRSASPLSMCGPWRRTWI